MKKVTMTRRRAREEVELGGEETCKVALEHGGAAAISQRDHSVPTLPQRGHHYIK